MARGTRRSERVRFFFNTSGVFNTAVGFEALVQNTTGGHNIAIGNAAGRNLTTGSNNIAIGNTGVAGESDTTRIGTTQTKAFVAGVSSAISVNGSQVVIDSAGRLGVGKISQLLRLAANTTPPVACSGAEKGSLYADDSSNELCFCDGSAWVGISAGGACN